MDTRLRHLSRIAITTTVFLIGMRAAAQNPPPDMFRNLPKNDPAYEALNRVANHLGDSRLLLGITRDWSGTGSLRTLTRYEFAVAIDRILLLLHKSIGRSKPPVRLISKN